MHEDKTKRDHSGSETHGIGQKQDAEAEAHLLAADSVLAVVHAELEAVAIELVLVEQIRAQALVHFHWYLRFAVVYCRFTQ